MKYCLKCVRNFEKGWRNSCKVCKTEKREKETQIDLLFDAVVTSVAITCPCGEYVEGFSTVAAFAYRLGWRVVNGDVECPKCRLKTGSWFAKYGQHY